MGSLTMIQTLYRYGTWATGRIFEEATHLSAAEFTQIAPGGSESVRDTLVHLIWGEDLWLARMREAISPDHPDPGDFPDLAAVRSRWEEVDSAIGPVRQSTHILRSGSLRFLRQLARRNLGISDLANAVAPGEPRHPAPQRAGHDVNCVRPLTRLARLHDLYRSGERGRLLVTVVQMGHEIIPCSAPR